MSITSNRQSIVDSPTLSISTIEPLEPLEVLEVEANKLGTYNIVLTNKLRDIIVHAQQDKHFRQKLDIQKLLAMSTMCKQIVIGLNIAIIGYASPMVAPWDPFTCNEGLPGSEECAVYATQELARQGHTVTVYMNPPSNSIWLSTLSNPRWLHVNEWINPDNTTRYDLVLMWRRFDVENGRKRSRTVFSWLHDSPNSKNVEGFRKFDGVCVLSAHHYKQLSIMPNFTTIPHTISGNGLVLAQFNKPMSFTNSYSIGYFSNYSRGLDILLDIWPLIHNNFPLATLDIYYGRETWGALSAQELLTLVSTIEKLKSQGVTEHGKVGHLLLAAAMQRTSVWCYPCIDLGETFCITAVKCQASGCIPITTRIGALAETIHPAAPHINSINSSDDVVLYSQLVLQTLARIRDENPLTIKQERQKYIEYGNQYSWEACINKWLMLYNKLK